jgi:hypothetical protein
MKGTSMEDSPNTNTLEGYRCPSCGSYGPFHIAIRIMALVDDDGVLEVMGDTYWDENSYASCAECRYEGTARKFFTDTTTEQSA